MKAIKDFKSISIHLASPELIREYSYGEVKRPETINYRTLKPEKDGLFCERIFGPTKDYECACGKFKSIRYKGVICDRCGVEVTESRVRRERMGHIELAAPVAHIWYYRITPSKIATLLGLTRTELQAILYFEKFIVVDPGDTDLEPYQVLTEDEYWDYRDKYKDSFEAGTGAEVIRELLRRMDLEEVSRELRDIMREKGKKTDQKILRRLELVDALRKSGNRPEWMILEVLPVISPELRPMVPLDGGRFATSDLNDLYRRVINRNNRLKKLLALNAPDIIIRNEKRMLQDAVDALFDNTRKGSPVKGSGNKVLKSLSDMLKGKQGRFRQNLLGKRVDYSGRSVIIVGPHLKLHQCGLPKKMALELFKPFVMKKLVDKGIVHNIKAAKKMIEKQHPDVWESLEEVVKEHPVLLNRAPTLHRLSIQAFEPVLVDDEAIQLHPLVCHAFNADFDGDQMAIHIPLSPEAQIESWVLMLSARNLINPANGKPVVFPTQDMVLGLYYLTKEKPGDEGEGKMFSSPYEVMFAVETGKVSYNARIKVRYYNGEIIETTPGRVIFNEIIPEGMRFINKLMKSSDLEEVISECFKRYGVSTTARMVDKMKDLGFKFATVFGATISLDHIKIPESKSKIVEEADRKVEKIEEEARRGIMSYEEKYNRVIDIWAHVNEQIKVDVEETLKKDLKGFNPVYVMMDSGARGSKEQVKQLAGMRGLMSKPTGEIIELPIRSNFKEGLSVLEYFISTHGARKGLADTALKTADAGYLTRRLVDIAQDVVITMEDCGTVKGIKVSAIMSGDQVVKPLWRRIVGRTSLMDIHDPKTGEILVKANELISEDIAKKIEERGIEEVWIRSNLTCEAPHGVCAKCYGWDLSTHELVKVGEAVGIIAAQSIGQPGTQLTMRTFHIGGIASTSVEKDRLDLSFDALVIKLPTRFIVDEKGDKITTRRDKIVVARVLRAIGEDEIVEVNENAKTPDGWDPTPGEFLFKLKNGEVIYSWERTRIFWNEKSRKYLIVDSSYYEHSLQIGSILKVNEGDFVEAGAPLTVYDPYNEPIIAEQEGQIVVEEVIQKAESRIPRSSLVKIVDPENPNMVLSRDFIPTTAKLLVKDGDKVKPGHIIAKRPREKRRATDIVGGLPRVTELFEARRPKAAAAIAYASGKVKIDVQKTKIVITIITDSGEEIKHSVPPGRYLYVRDGDYVEVGEQLSEGVISPHDVLAVKGEQEVAEFLLNEIQSVYMAQRVNIDDKHIGIIVRQMLRKVEIVDPGDTDFIIGQQVDKITFMEENRKVIEEGGQPARAKIVLLGLSKAALTIDSFLSAASFQETTRVLADAAVKGKVDKLRGLKENLILGKLIPAGTGMDVYKSVDVAVVKGEEEEEVEENIA